MQEDMKPQSEPNDPSSPRLARVLGLKELLAIHIGVIIGSGIFIVPATIAGRVGSTGPMLLVWIVAGMLTLFGTLSLAELSSVLPQAGGPYVYLRESYGRVWGFLFAWNDFFDPSIYLSTRPDLQPIAVALASFNGIYSRRPPLIQAASLMTLILPVILFFAAQRVFMQGVVVTGVDK